MSKQSTATVVGFITLPAAPVKAKPQAPQAQKQTPEPRKGRPLSAVLGAANNPEADRPVIQLPSGVERAVAHVRVIPHIGFADITTVPDLADRGEARTVRVPLNTPIIGWAKLPQKPTPEQK